MSATAKGRKGRQGLVDKHHQRGQSPRVSEVYKLSPLDQEHRDLAARMVPFAGWEMPVFYRSILEEHHAVREKVGVFDISHMGQLMVSGKNAAKWLDLMLTNNVAELEEGDAQYTFLLNEEGGVIDDLILYRLADEHFLLVVNASQVDEDEDWLEDRLGKGVKLENQSADWGGLAIQGPDAPQIYSRLTGGRCLPARHQVDDFMHEGERLLVCRTGYTGEDGFELFCQKSAMSLWWKLLIDEAVTPCGLGARDTLRLEMCYPLNGSDLSPERTPLEAGLGFFVDLEKEAEFPGQDILRQQAEEGPAWKLCALRMDEGTPPPRAGYEVVDGEGAVIGSLTSGAISPSLGHGIALAWLPAAHARRGREVGVMIRGQVATAKVVKKPFYRG